LQNEEFVFVVKGKELKSTVAEAVLISSKVHENLRSARGNHRFENEIEIENKDEHITLNDFVRFLDFNRSL
jgi:hypothetical protein